jgi:integrase
VFTREEVASLFRLLDGEMALLIKLLYGTGMRLMEGLRLRIKDVADRERWSSQRGSNAHICSGCLSAAAVM